MTIEDRRTDPHFSQPVRQILTMLIVLGLTIAGAILIYPTVAGVFLSSPWLNSFIALVFVIGVAACFWQVAMLIGAVSWIEGFAADRPGYEITKAPQLLASLAALLSQKRARRALTSTSTRSILDSVSMRLEEQRDLTRYIINLLIFLGLLGTFYGLSTVVPAVVDTIRSLAPQEGQGAVEVFDNLMGGLEGQLGGMGTAFASSLLGLAGSLVIGLLDLFASHGQNRFFRELEEWLSSITRLGVAGLDSDEPLTSGSMIAVLEQTSLQIDALREVVEAGAARAAQTDARIDALAGVVAKAAAESAERAAERAERAADRGGGGRTQEMDLLERLAVSQEQVAALLGARDQETGRLDAETRARLRSIDTQVLRILEDMAAGRQDLLTEMRQDISGLAEALRGLTARSR